MDWDSLLDCQGAQEEPEGRPGGPVNLQTARGVPRALSLVLLAFLLALPGLPGNPSSFPYLEAYLKGHIAF